MSNEYAPDSRQSVDLKWKLRKALEKNVAPRDDGKGLDFGQDVGVDGKLHLNDISDIVGPDGSALFTDSTQENVSSAIDSILYDYMRRKYESSAIITETADSSSLPIPQCVSLGKCIDFAYAYAGITARTLSGPLATSVKFAVNMPQTNFNYAFADIAQSLAIDFDGASFGAYGVYGIFYSSTGITAIKNLDTSQWYDYVWVFADCTSLASLSGCSGWHASFDVSETALAHDALVELIGQLETVTTAQTLTMGDAKLALLSDEEKLGATNKGWTLA